ncbi:MAG: hypothetical protein IID36_10975 [Planctomycetes bacterium]|nr:hypothetical protein [Planctomycetota bacterium]
MIEPSFCRACRFRGTTRIRAFTLVDAVVCTLVLFVVPAIVLPSVAGIGRSSKDSRCLANMGRIAYANAVYAAQDPANMAIPVHAAFVDKQGLEPLFIGPYEWGGKSGVGKAAVPDDVLTSRYGTAQGFGPARRPLNDIVYGDVFEDYTDDPGEGNKNWIADTMLDLDVNRCPSDSGYGGIHTPDFRDERRTSYDHFGTSYGANMFMVGSTGGGCMSSNSPYLHRMSEIISPSTTLAYQENVGRFAWAAEEDPCAFLNGIPGTVRGWHGKDWTFNAAFLDGHADAIYMRGYRAVPLGAYPPFLMGGGSCPCTPPSCHSNEFPGSFQIYRCVIIRGEGWQKDTLPTAPVMTQLKTSGTSGRPSYEGGLE